MRGEFGYHRSFIVDYAIIVAPLTEGLRLTKDEKKKFRTTGQLPDPKTVAKAMAKCPFKTTPK